MVSFLTRKQEHDFRRFVNTNLAEKYQQPIMVYDDFVVVGTTGDDVVKECLKINFIPANAKVQWVEDKIANDIHKYCYEHDLRLCKHIVVERTYRCGEIVYSLIYTNSAV